MNNHFLALSTAEMFLWSQYCKFMIPNRYLISTEVSESTRYLLGISFFSKTFFFSSHSLYSLLFWIKDDFL